MAVTTVVAATAGVASLPAAQATTGTLPGGSSISVNITSPANPTTVNAGTDVVVTGTASVGSATNMANSALITVIDDSGSTADNSGSTACLDPNGDGSSNTVLDCELTSAINLNSAAVTAGTVAHTGAVVFGSTAVTADVSPATGDQHLTTPAADGPPANGTRDMDQVYKSTSLTGVGLFTNKSAGGSTDFTAALQAANTDLSGSTDTRKIVAFMSDGFANAGGSTATAVANLVAAGAVVYTFAVGTGSSCGSAMDSAHESLAYIAAQGHGTCTAVTNPGNLPTILPALITSRLTGLSITDNAGSATTITSTTPALPVDGPTGTVNYSIDMGVLAPGTHNLCVTATGVDPTQGTVTACTVVTVNTYALTITAVDKTKVYGDPNPPLTFSVTGLQGTDTLTSDPSCSTTATSASNVGGYPITCNAAVADPTKYTISYVPGTLTVTQAASVVQGPPVSKNFGDPDPSFAPTASNGAPVPSGAVCTAPTPHESVAGSPYTLTCTGPASQGNFTYTYANGSLTVNPAASVVSVPTVHKTFGTPDPSFTPVASNGAPVPTGTSCSVTVTHTDVGTYPIVCTGPSVQGNYKYTYAGGSLVVDAAPAVVQGPTLHKPFGSADPVFTPTVTNGAPMPGGVSCTISVPHVNVGSYPIVCTGPNAQGNYSYTYTDGTLIVDPLAVVVTGPAARKTYGDPDPAFTPTVSGGAPLPATAVCVPPNPHEAVAGSPYLLVCTGPSTEGNYSYTYMNGSLTIDPKQVIVTAPTVSKTYGSPDPALTPTSSGLLNGDPLPASITCTATNPHVNVGTYDITCGGPDAAGNYSFQYVNPGHLTITMASPVLGTVPSGQTAAGGFANDTATLTHTGAAGGVVAFTLYGPGDPNCRIPLSTSNGTLVNNVANSGPVQVGAAGTYRWVATYAGDANNNAAVSPCGAELFAVYPQRLTAQAYGLSVHATLGALTLLNIKPTPLAGPLNTTTTTSVEPKCVASIALLVGVNAICATASVSSGVPSASFGAAGTAAVAVPIQTIPLISVRAVEATSMTTCAGSLGTTTIAYLAVGNTVIISKPTPIAPNTTVNVGLVKLVLNEQIHFNTPDRGLTVNAVHVTVNALNLAKVDLVISSAESDIANCP